MKIGITQLCIKGSLAEVIEKTIGWGYEALEIELTLKDGILNLDDPAQKAVASAQIVRDAGLDFASVVGGSFSDCSLFDADAGKRTLGLDRLRRTLDLLARMQVRTLLLVPGTLVPEVCYDVAMQLLVESLSKVSSYAQERGVDIGLENVWNRFLVSPLDMRSVLDQVDSSSVGVYLDIGNMVPWNYPEHWIRILANRIIAVHFKDLKREGCHFNFVPLMQGDVNWKSVMRELKACGYCGPAVSEVVGDDATQARMVAIMKTIISYQ